MTKTDKATISVMGELLAGNRKALLAARGRGVTVDFSVLSEIFRYR